MTDQVTEPVVVEPVVNAEPVVNELAVVVDADWRKEIAGEDEKILSHLSRYNTQKDAIKAGFELKQKVSSGEYKRAIAFPKDGTPEAQTEWRKENGIPEAPDKYGMPNGLVIGDNDKPIVADFLKRMHESNVPENAAKEAVDWYFKAQEQTAAQASEADKAQKTLIEETLRTEWGPEFIPNKNMTENFVKSRFGDIVGEALLASSPEVVKELANIARELNPAATLVPNSSNPLKSIGDEMSQLREQMKNPEKWAKNTSGQQRMLQLLEAESRFK